MLGGPGAGKGTQCLNVVRRMRGWATISAGDCLRECRKERPDSSEAKTIEENISKGLIVPAEITVKLLNDKVGFSTEHQRRGRVFSVRVLEDVGRTSSHLEVVVEEVVFCDRCLTECHPWKKKFLLPDVRICEPQVRTAYQVPDRWFPAQYGQRQHLG